MFINTAQQFSPIDLSPLIWIDANVGITESGGSVSSWVDQSGNGNSFTQGVGSQQPLYQATGLGGLPTVYFDGTDEMLTGTLSSTLYATTIYIVFQEISATASGPSIMGQTSGTNNKRVFINPPEGTTRVFLWDGGTNSIIAESGTYNYYTPIIASLRMNTSGSGSGKLNDDTWTTGSVTSATSSDLPMKLGNRGSGTARRLVGNVSELIIFQAVHTDAEAVKVINYLNDKWSIF